VIATRIEGRGHFVTVQGTPIDIREEAMVHDLKATTTRAKPILWIPLQQALRKGDRRSLVGEGKEAHMNETGSRFGNIKWKLQRGVAEAIKKLLFVCCVPWRQPCQHLIGHHPEVPPINSSPMTLRAEGRRGRVRGW
jgi:hypothetical protein